MMAELAATGAYAPWTIHLWRTLLNWMAFFFQIFAQIIRGTPSFTQVLSSRPPQFKPLPVVELAEFAKEQEEAPPPDSVSISGGGESNDSPALEKLTVVLDLDETLVCAYETSSMPPMVRNQATEASIKWFELECISSDKVMRRYLSREYTVDMNIVLTLFFWVNLWLLDGKPKISYVTVFERPGLREFLNQLSEFADIVLFTAGLEGYARPLVDRIDVEKRFSHRLYRPSTISTEYCQHVKDLSCLSKDICRIVIVDNNPFSFSLQPLNGIPCIPFSPGQPHDEQVTDTTFLHQKLGLTFGSASLPASGGYPSFAEAPFSAKGCTPFSIRKVPYA